MAAAQERGSSVVVGFDSSDSARDALTLGARFATAIGGTVLVAAVHPASPAGAGHVDAEWLAAMREDAQDRLDRARAMLGDEIDADFRLVASGSAAHGLDDLAESMDATAIVVGSAKDGPLRRLLAGSTAERLLHGASVPVAVVPRGLRPGLADSVSVIGCAFIDTPDGHEALRVAADLAEQAHARLRVLTVVGQSREFALFGGREQREIAEGSRSDYQAAVDKAVEGLTQRVSASAELLTGEVGEALAALDDRDVDLLVCGSRGYGPLRRVLLGGTSSRLVHHAATAVMVAPRSAG